MLTTRRTPRRLFPSLAIGTAALGASALGACGGEDAGSTDGFCAELAAQADAMMNPQIASQDDAEAYVDIYRDLEARAPLAIEEDWTVLVDVYESVLSVPPGDAAAADEARRSVYAAQASSDAVRTWVATNCDLDLATVGPVVTTAATATTTTVP